MHTETFRSTVFCCGLVAAVSSVPVLAQNIGSFRDTGKGAVDYRQTVAESKEECAALGRMVLA